MINRLDRLVETVMPMHKGDVEESWGNLSGMKSSQALGNVMYDSPIQCIGFQSFL